MYKRQALRLLAVGAPKGTYVLLLRVSADLNLKTRAKKFKIKRGYYIYVGSALSNLSARLKRHERRQKRNFWHIDFLLGRSELILAIAIVGPQRLEDSVASLCMGEPVEGFGASDSALSSHLFRYSNIKEALSDAFRALLKARGRRGPAQA